MTADRNGHGSRLGGHGSKLVRPRRAAIPEIPVLARLIAVAFDDLGVSRWLVPRDVERATILPDYFAILVGHATQHGWVDTVTDRSAVAVWLPGGDRAVPAITEYDRRLTETCGSHTDRFHRLDRAMAARHPIQPPHEYLALLAVHPGRQGTGLGSALLHHRHRLLDRVGRPAYVEASSMRSRDLYARHGYRVVGAPFAPGDCTASLWPMWRPGRGQTPAGDER